MKRDSYFIISMALIFLAIGLTGIPTQLNAQYTHRLFLTNEGQEIYYSRYDKIVSSWEALKKDLFINTSFGLTHVIHHQNPGKPALMLFHAAGCSAASWYENFDYLSGHFEVVAIDTPGDAGKSVLYDSTLTVTAYNNWILEILNYFNYPETILCGHSIGGFIIANFSMSYPDRVQKLILLAPAATFRNFKWYIKLALNMSGKSGKGPSAEKTLKMQACKTFILDSDFVELMEAVREYCSVNMIFPFKLADDEILKIKIPTLVLIPENEVIYNPKKAYKRAVRLLPEAEIDLISNCGHTLIMEQHNTVNKRIADFCSSE